MFKIGDIVRVVDYMPYTGLISAIVSKHGDINIITDIKGNQLGFLDFQLELVAPVCPAVQNNMSILTGGTNESFWGINRQSYEGWSGTIKLNLDDKKCECGSHSVGVDKHSDYCPLYTKS